MNMLSTLPLAFNPLEFDPGVVVFSFVVFLTVVAILGKVAWGPLLEKLEEREQKIQGGLEEAEKAREEARRIQADFEKQVKEAQAEARRIAQDAKSQAERLSSQIESEARARADGLLESARREIAAAQRAATEEVRTKAVDLAIAAAEAVVRKNVDDAQNRELAAKVIQMVSEDDGRRGGQAS